MQLIMIPSLKSQLCLRDHPGINVNWKEDQRWTPLHGVSVNGHHEIVKLLLAHPAINVNSKTRTGDTPFLFACLYGRVSVVRELLKDPRVDITLADNKQCTPLWWASRNGHHEVIECLIASGRDLGDIENQKGKHWDGKNYSALEIARRNRKTEVVSLLERFIANPAQTRREVRAKLGVLDELAAEVFALSLDSFSMR